MDVSVLGFYGPGPAELILIIFAIIIAFVFTAVKIFSFCKIFSRMGYSWAFGLLMLVPFAEIVLPLILALIEWPVSRELRLLKNG